MEQQKGFSLIEVLVSFLLMTTVGFFLLEFYGRSVAFFQQTLQSTQAASLLDSFEDVLITGRNAQAPVDSDYELRLVQESGTFNLEILSNKNHPLLIRHYSNLAVFQ